MNKEQKKLIISFLEDHCDYLSSRVCDDLYGDYEQYINSLDKDEFYNLTKLFLKYNNSGKDDYELIGKLNFLGYNSSLLFLLINLLKEEWFKDNDQ